jgi:hypothetical protein
MFCGREINRVLARDHGDLLHNLGASLYAPPRVALFETDGGEVGFDLDRALEAALIKAAG